MFTINKVRAKTLAKILREMEYMPEDFEDVTPFQDDTFREMHFFFFLTAIDHNVHGAQRYEAVIDGATVHGSELLYLLARNRAANDPDLLTPERLKDVPEESLREMFTTPEGKVPVGVAQRAALLRNAASLLLEKYRGDLRNLFSIAGDFLRREDAPGILSLLREFKAYEDPMEKKSFLLVKVLRRRRLITIRDPENLRAPIDHVLFTVALRSGLVMAEEPAKAAITAEIPATEEMVRELRLAALEAYEATAAYSGIPVDVFDDLLWAYGRECLKFRPPLREDELDGIRIGLDDRVKNKDALREFLRFINGLDSEAPDGVKLYPVPSVPPTWYF